MCFGSRYACIGGLHGRRNAVLLSSCFQWDANGLPLFSGQLCDMEDGLSPANSTQDSRQRSVSGVGKLTIDC
jgi:hypothetical protein